MKLTPKWQVKGAGRLTAQRGGIERERRLLAPFCLSIFTEGNAMPRKAPKPCGRTGCGELTYNRYCEKHQKEAERDYNRNKRDKEAKKYYDTPRWKTLRKVKLARDPLCEICRQNGGLIEASHVDHIIEISDGGDPYDLDNLQSLCISCHSSKTLRERNKRDKIWKF